ncbi:unnamed protein product, partial [Staurois parvus]
MTMGREELTCEVLKGLTVFCFTVSCLGHTPLDGCAQHSHPKQCAYSEANLHHPLVKHTQH